MRERERDVWLGKVLILDSDTVAFVLPSIPIVTDFDV